MSIAIAIAILSKLRIAIGIGDTFICGIGIDYRDTFTKNREHYGDKSALCDPGQNLTTAQIIFLLGYMALRRMCHNVNVLGLVNNHFVPFCPTLPYNNADSANDESAFLCRKIIIGIRT